MGFEDDHAFAAPGQLQGGGKARDPGADDADVAGFVSAQFGPGRAG